MNRTVARLGTKALDSDESLTTQAAGTLAATAVGGGLLYWASGPIPFLEAPGTFLAAALLGGAVWVKGKFSK